MLKIRFVGPNPNIRGKGIGLENYLPGHGRGLHKPQDTIHDSPNIHDVSRRGLAPGEPEEMFGDPFASKNLIPGDCGGFVDPA